MGIQKKIYHIHIYANSNHRVAKSRALFNLFVSHNQILSI